MKKFTKNVEPKLGEKFQFDDVTLITEHVPDECTACSECYFDMHGGDACGWFNCCLERRADGCDVIFRRIK